MAKAKRPLIGLALGSGGARGLAHIGVIKALEKNDISIDFIAGSSIGAMVGGFYTAGIGIEKIEEIALGTTWRQVLSVLFEPKLKRGLIGGEKVKTFIESYVDGKEFKDCNIPFAAIATDLKTGEPVILNDGKLAPAIRASMSIPLVFRPAEIEGKMLADGGLSAPVPVTLAKNMGADVVIAVNLDKHYYDEKWKPGLYDITNDALNILRHHLALLNSASADISIGVYTGKTYWYKFVNGQDKILAGEKATEKAIPQLKKIIREQSKNNLKKHFEFFKGNR